MKNSFSELRHSSLPTPHLQYRQEVEQQKKLVEEQQRTVQVTPQSLFSRDRWVWCFFLIPSPFHLVQRLTQTKFNQDFLLDIGFLATGLYIVNMSIVQYPLQLATSVLSLKKDKKGNIIMPPPLSLWKLFSLTSPCLLLPSSHRFLHPDVQAAAVPLFHQVLAGAGATVWLS